MIEGGLFPTTGGLGIAGEFPTCPRRGTLRAVILIALQREAELRVPTPLPEAPPP